MMKNMKAVTKNTLVGTLTKGLGSYAKEYADTDSKYCLFVFDEVALPAELVYSKEERK